MIETDVEKIKGRFKKLESVFDERMRRLFSAAEASVLGHGGVTLVSQRIKQKWLSRELSDNR